MTLDREKNLGKAGNGCLAVPVALQFADELNPACRLATGLLEPSQSRFVGFKRCTGTAIDDGINFESLGNCIEGGMHETNLSPQGSHDEFFAAGRFDRIDEIFVLPGVDGCPVYWFDILQDVR